MSDDLSLTAAEFEAAPLAQATDTVPDHHCTFMTGEKRQQELTYLWTIHDIKAHMKNFRVGEKIETATFTINNSRWHFELYPQNHANYSTSHIVIFLVSENDETFIVDFEVSVGKTPTGWAYSHTWENNRISENGLVGASNFLPHAKVYEEEALFIQQHKMDFFMKVYIRHHNSTSTRVVVDGLSRRVNKQTMLEQLALDQELLLNDDKFADFKIVCGDEIINCHKMILSMRSKYFKALLTTDMKEKADERMEIVDMTPEIVKDVIKYIYTGRVEDIDAKSKELLKPAELYDLTLLKQACELSMVASLTPDNAIEYIILADLYRAVDLKQAAKRTIVENKVDIIKQTGWKETLCDNPILLCELFEAFTSLN